MRIKPEVIIQKLGNTCVAYDNETSTLHELNEIGFLILLGMEKKKTRQRIVKEITNKYKVSKNRAEKDYEKFVGLLKKKDLIIDKK